jgi:hypothetical protein
MLGSDLLSFAALKILNLMTLLHHGSQKMSIAMFFQIIQKDGIMEMGINTELLDKSQIHHDVDDKKINMKTDLSENLNVLGGKIYVNKDIVLWEFHVENLRSM